MDIKTNNRIHYFISSSIDEIKFYYKDESGKQFNTINNVRNHLASENQDVAFAFNGGMYKKDRSPQGLYIEHGEIIEPIDTITKGFGNFYLQPNGIFYISNQNQAFVKQTQEFSLNQEIKFATQSGPMLVVDGKIHPKFKQGSTHLNIRNGVGILPNGQVLFAISKEPVSLFDFASFFLQNDCEQALYLDGFVSRAYYPEQNINDDGDFGVIIAVNE